MELSTHISQKGMKNKGFTLVELLVVIGILGILAAGLLAAIDPLEQLRKGRDQNRRNIAVEYHNALTRYYATFGSMPWGTGVIGGSTLNAGAATLYTTTLVALGELKSTFAQAAAGNLALLTLAGTGTGDVTVCFNPESKSLSLDPTTIFTSAVGGTGGTCPSATDTALCFSCAR